MNDKLKKGLIFLLVCILGICLIFYLGMLFVGNSISSCWCMQSIKIEGSLKSSLENNSNCIEQELSKNEIELYSDEFKHSEGIRTVFKFNGSNSVDGYVGCNNEREKFFRIDSGDIIECHCGK